MAFFCPRGHVHSERDKADSCYICKRRDRRRDGKRSNQKNTAHLTTTDGSPRLDGNGCAASAAPMLPQMAEAHQDRICNDRECPRGGAEGVGLSIQGETR